MKFFSKLAGLVSNPLSVLEDRITNRNTFAVMVVLVTFYALVAAAGGVLGIFLFGSVALKVISGLLAIDGVIILRGLLVNPPKLVTAPEADEDAFYDGDETFSEEDPYEDPV